MGVTATNTSNTSKQQQQQEYSKTNPSHSSASQQPHQPPSWKFRQYDSRRNNHHRLQQLPQIPIRWNRWVVRNTAPYSRRVRILIWIGIGTIGLAWFGIVLWTMASFFLWMFRHFQCYSREYRIVWKEGNAHSISRPCLPTLDYLTLDQQQQNNRPLIPPHQICITTLSDSPSRGTKANVGGENTKWWFFLFFFQTPKCRDFSNVAERTRPNMRRYARTHGYTFMDHNRHQSLLDTSRPPAWSKIKAVQYALDTNQCRYVLWLDADVVITNSTIRLEQIIPYDPNPMNNNNNNNNDTSFDIIVTSDRRFTANSGVWIISNSTWSRSFLDQWWNMRNYVRAKGLSLSGDNDAFGALIRKYQQQQHVHMLPARCHLNSFGVFVPNNSPPSQFQQNVGSTDFYHAGDFIAHASGIDQKDVGIQFLLQRAQS